MRRLLPALASALTLLVVLPAAADARPGSWCEQTGQQGTVQDWTCQWGEDRSGVEVAGYEVRQEMAFGIPKPPVDGAITSMDVDVTDADGAPVSIKRLMLHHIVFLNMGSEFGEKRDATCDDVTSWDSRTRLPAVVERFYAAGEERATMDLPPGYGYKSAARETWGITWMFMNHRAQADRAYVRYHLKIDTAPDLTPVKPYWLDVANCRADPVYDVPGGGAKGSTHTRSSDVVMPEAGRIVASAGHVHGGAKELVVRRPACPDGGVMFRSRPAWGTPTDPFYTVTPILHEPGPRGMSGTVTQKGIPVAKGETVRLDSVYDNALPHTRVMGIAIFYLAPDSTVTEPCGARPDDVREAAYAGPHRDVAPRFTVPLTGLDARGRAVRIDRPAGATKRLRSGSTITVGDNFFSAPNVEVAAGATLRWRFPSRMQLHNVTVASGPRGFGSPNLDRGRSFTMTLTVPGTYKLFCALHPVSMTQTVTVRAKRRR